MIKRILLVLTATALGLTLLNATPLGSSAPAAAAPGCAAVEVVFARGTAEALPPAGATGLSFEFALNNRLPNSSVRLNAVRYPASSNFSDRHAFVRNVVKGINDAQAQIRSLARRCPNSSIVLGGYSQGAVVASYAVADRIDIPARYAQYRSDAPRPLEAAYAPRIAAVVLFGTPSARWIRDVGAPPMRVGAAYRNKTAQYCIPGDNVCDGSRVGQPSPLHVLYSVNGMTGVAADFAARRIR